ncbi:MAG TPA: Wzz/FepE/Etk N-terminal domain-containing protein [Gaiellaceae bacterium]|nr:Wzz/FepE/Etk N-terminal domain-containing protein [Gaiellaceae bacterium]
MSASPERQAFDPEAEQEIDFGRYVRLLAARWWLIVAGLILGAVIGYAVSLGGSQRYQATATLYLGQPYSASGNVQLQAAQTNPSTVRQIVHSTSIVDQVAVLCKAKAGTFKGGISTQTVSGNIAKNGQTPLVTVSVQTAKRKVATCAANALARLVIAKTSAFANQKIANFRREIVVDEKQEALINRSLQTGGQSTSDQLLLQLRLATVQTDRLNVTQLLSQARQVESPSVLTAAAPNRITARSHRNTAVVAAIIGAIIGALAALLWDGIAAATQRRRMNNG